MNSHPTRPKPVDSVLAQKVELRPVDEIKVQPDNARVHGKGQIKALAKSMQAFGVNAPLLVGPDGVLVAGHGRLEALKLLGYTHAPVIELSHLTPDQARAYAIADNRITDLSSFDRRALGRHFQILQGVDLDFELEATGFSAPEIDLLIEEITIEGPANETNGGLDEADMESLPPTGPPVSELGSLWRLGKHRLYCGSALEADSYARLLLPGETVAAGFADSPYNGGSVNGFYSRRGKHREFVEASGEMSPEAFRTFLKTAFEHMARAMKPGGVLFSCIDWRGVSVMEGAAHEAGFTTLNLCVWTKTTPGQGALYRSQHELVWVFRKGRTQHRNNVRSGSYGRNRSNVWAYPGANQFLRASEDGDLVSGHPTPKPVKLVADAFLDVTARGEVVLDLFTGSGASLLAAERTGRRFRGIDLDPLYVDLSIRRWQRLTGEDAVLESTGQTFSALESRRAGR